jgi:hypothetical protein
MNEHEAMMTRLRQTSDPKIVQMVGMFADRIMVANADESGHEYEWYLIVWLKSVGVTDDEIKTVFGFSDEIVDRTSLEDPDYTEFVNTYAGTI